MTADQLLFLAILALSMWFYITQRIPVIANALMTITLLAISGVIPLNEALSGFSNPATISIAAMFVLSAGLIRSGALEPITRRLADWSKGVYSRLIMSMALVVPGSSAFINNTPVVVMLAPVMMGLGRRFNISPSKLMMPLSFFSIFGGTCTLIGTSTNLLIDEIYTETTGVHLQVFEFAWLGIPFLILGGIYMVTLGAKLMPHRENLSALLPIRKRSRYVTEMIVNEGSALIGRSVEEVFPKDGDLRLLQLLRGEEWYLDHKAKKMDIAAGDALILEGAPQALTDLLARSEVELGTVLEDSVRVPIRSFSLSMFELVVLPDSPYVGSRVRDLNLNKQYGVKVLAIQRGGQHHRMDIRAMRLKAGDMLLVQGDLKAIESMKDHSELLVIEELDQQIRKPHKAKLATLIMATVVLVASIDLAPLVIAALGGVTAMLLTRCLKTEEIIHSLDFNVLFLLVGTIPFGYALQRTGLVDMMSTVMYDNLGANPWLLLSVLYLLTNVLTSLLSNTAVAVLMTPLAIGLAQQMGVEPKPFVMAVAFAASAAFATPISYQTNIIVMGPGGYKFGDFAKVGIPLSIILWLTASVLIPIIWPLQ